MGTGLGDRQSSAQSPGGPLILAERAAPPPAADSAQKTALEQAARNNFSFFRAGDPPVGRGRGKRSPLGEARGARDLSPWRPQRKRQRHFSKNGAIFPAKLSRSRASAAPPNSHSPVSPPRGQHPVRREIAIVARAAPVGSRMQRERRPRAVGRVRRRRPTDLRANYWTAGDPYIMRTHLSATCHLPAARDGGADGAAAHGPPGDRGAVRLSRQLCSLRAARELQWRRQVRPLDSLSASRGPLKKCNIR